jgi:WhiB family redox-sensing transcriptional regulator
MSVNEGTAHALLSRAADAPGRDEGYWRRRAACRDEDPELFFPVGSAGSAALAQIAEAKKICARCPVRRACLVFAMATGQEYGIWGGLTEGERSQLHRRVAGKQTAAVPATVGCLPPGPAGS